MIRCGRCRSCELPGPAELVRTRPQIEDRTHWRGRRRLFKGSEEHTSELQSLMRISYAVFCLKKKKSTSTTPIHSTSASSTTNSKHIQRHSTQFNYHKKIHVHNTYSYCYKNNKHS